MKKTRTKWTVGVVAAVWALSLSSSARAADITGFWSGWACLYSDPSGTCGHQHFDYWTELAIYSDPKAPPAGDHNEATYIYKNDNNITCNDTLVYESDLGGTPGSYHYWQFADQPQANQSCHLCPGTVVLAVRIDNNGAVTGPMEYFWYANAGDPAGCDQGGISGYLNPVIF